MLYFVIVNVLIPGTTINKSSRMQSLSQILCLHDVEKDKFHVAHCSFVEIQNRTYEKKRTILESQFEGSSDLFHFFLPDETTIDHVLLEHIE
jgi:hypothetical protein